MRPPSGSVGRLIIRDIICGYTIALSPGWLVVIHRFILFFKGVHAFAAEGRLRFVGQKCPIPIAIGTSIPMCLWPQDPHTSKKSDRCFWGISGIESIPGMIPKSNARWTYLNESATFFLILLQLQIESSFGSTNYISTLDRILPGLTTVHPACAGPALPIAGIGLLGFGRKGALNPCTFFHKSLQLSNPEKCCRFIHLLYFH